MIKVFERLRNRQVRRARKAVRLAGKHVRDRMVDNASLTDHTLKDLAEIGHPYSRLQPVAIHDPEFLVHKQRGTLAAAVGVRFEEDKNKIAAIVGVDEAKAPHVPHVIFGTRKMVARDFVSGTLQEEREVVSDIFTDTLRQKET